MEGKINIKNTLLYSIIALAAAGSVLVMLSTIFGLIFRFFIKVMEIDPNVLIQQQQLIEVASHVIALGIYFIVYKLIFRKDNKIQDEGVKVKKMGLCAMMGIGVSGISLLWIMLSHHIPMLQESGSMLEQSSKNMALGNPILVILLTAVFAPVIEEILFRGIIFRSLEKISSGLFPVIVSAILFGLCHMIFVQMVYAFGMGIVTALVYQKTRNLIYPMMIHMANNLLSALMDIVPISGFEGAVNILSIVMIIPTVYFLHRMMKKKEIETTVEYVK